VIDAQPAAHRALRLGLTVGLVLAGVTAAAAAQAQSPGALDRLSSEALFDDGLKLMQTRDFVAACPKLEASYRLDPGIGTLLYLADCYAATGRTASAWIGFREAAFAARKAGEPEREQAALQRAEALKPKLTNLLMLTQNAQADLELRLDGHRLVPVMFGVRIPVDPGPHVIEASASGHQPWRQALTVPPKPGLITINVPKLAVAPPSPPAAPQETRSSPYTAALGWIGVGLGAAALVGASSAVGGGVDPWPGPIAVGGAGFACAVGGTILLITTTADEPSGGGRAAASSRTAWGVGWQGRW
jgi:serine/threonine-protein kinase